MEAFSRMLGGPGAQKSLKNQRKINIFEIFLEGNFFAQDAPKRRQGRCKMARRTESRGPGGGLRRGYISRQVAKSLEDRQVQSTKMDGRIDSGQKLDCPPSSTPFRRAAAD